MSALVRATSADALKVILHERQDVYTILRHTSASGMLRRISVVVIDGGTITDITWHVANVAGYTMHYDSHALTVKGGGMDMGFAVVYQLASMLYGDGYALNQRWL